MSQFHLGEASELSGHRDNALELLGKAVQRGLPTRVIRSDPDLLALRSDPGYHTLVLAQAKTAQK